MKFFLSNKITLTSVFNKINEPMQKIYISVTKTPQFLAKTPMAKRVSLAKDKNGYFVYTHRWASKRYKTINAIPKSIIEFCETTA